MRKAILFLGVVFLVSLISCDDDNDNNNNLKPMNPVPNFYPTEVGNYWNYERLFRIVGLDTNSNLPDSVYSVAQVIIEGKKLLNDTLNTYEFVEYHTNNNTNVVKTYFTNETSGFYMQAYRSAGIATPVKNGYKVIINDYGFNSIGELFDFISGLQITHPNIIIKPDTTYPPDSLYWEVPPIMSLSYPLEIDKEWVYREQSGMGGMNRKVLAKETITTPAGSFVCFKIKTIYLDPDWEDKIEYLDYISSQGLIQRDITLHIAFTDIEGNIIGTRDAIEKLKLTSYFVQ